MQGLQQAQGQTLGDLPVSSLVGGLGTHLPTGSVVVSHASPPIPAKLVLRIWRGEYVDMNNLLPYRLGAPEPTLADTLQIRQRELKQITSIEQWVVCFNAFISVIALQQPHRVRDLLAYSSIITKAAHDYEGNPWLAYDVHFRTLAASMQLPTWGQVDQALWSQHFNRATVRVKDGGSALAIGPYSTGQAEGADAGHSSSQARSGGKPTSTGKGKERVSPYPRTAPICIKWNRENCRSPACTYRHVCLSCHGQHREANCPSGASQRREPSRPTRPFRREGGGEAN